MLTTAATAYVERLAWLDERDAPLLVAHSYVRYLGDLSGGQVLGRVVAGALRLGDGRGTAFYTFGPPGAEALASRPEMTAFEEQVRAQTLTRSAARAGYLPTVGAQANLNAAGPSPTDTYPNWTASERQTTGFFGASVGPAGDVDNDGYGDIVVGAWNYESRGYVFVYHGSASGPAASFSATG